MAVIWRFPPLPPGSVDAVIVAVALAISFIFSNDLRYCSIKNFLLYAFPAIAILFPYLSRTYDFPDNYDLEKTSENARCGGSGGFWMLSDFLTDLPLPKCA